MTHDLCVTLDVQQLAVLQQLSSPALPIGGFTYSQGLEGAVELGLVHDEASTKNWVESQLHGTMTQSEVPLWCLMFNAWEQADNTALNHWNQWFHASRETQEIRLETVQMGDSLSRLVNELGWGSACTRETLMAIRPLTLPLAHSFSCAAWAIPQVAGITAYIFTWLENQVVAAIKSVPLGQRAGQRILDQIRQKIPETITEVLQRSRDTPPDLQTFSPQYGIVSSRHESQFSRLFRS